MIAPKALLHLAAFVLHHPRHLDSGHADIRSPGRKREGQHYLKQISQSSYHPYVRKSPPTPQAERKMAGMMGRLPSSIDSDHDEAVHEIFSQGLQRMSTKTVHHAAYYKEAELEYHCHLSMTLAWEAEKLLRLQQFINGEQQEQEEQTTRHLRRQHCLHVW
ncbi:hypothetical protein BDR07DRAFT_1495764 [Suillus spraguei]|nr:hypothetical protein BDR07DRAFT_1495764 [Suillus spraguei]